MQANRTADQAAVFTIPMVDAAGNKIDGLSASWELFDERGASIDAGVVADFDATADDVTFEIEATALALPVGVTSAGREIVVSITTASGEATVRDYFVLQPSRVLQVMTNSFQTYVEALGMRASFGPTLLGWDSSEEADRAAAMIDAHQRLLRMNYRLPFVDGMERASSYAYYGTGADEPFDATRRVRFTNMTLAEFDALPEPFRRAMKRAQLVEADVILGGDIVGRKRRDGIISESIGESSVFFSSKPYLNLPITRQAYEEIQRYVIFRIGVARG